MEGRRGDTETYDFVPRDSAGVLISQATISKIWFTLKKDQGDADSAAVLQKTIGSGIASVADAIDTDGLPYLGYRLTIDAGDLVTLPAPSSFQADLQFKDTSNKIHTPWSGLFQVVTDITKAIV